MLSVVWSGMAALFALGVLKVHALCENWRVHAQCDNVSILDGGVYFVHPLVGWWVMWVDTY